MVQVVCNEIHYNYVYFTGDSDIIRSMPSTEGGQ